MKQQQHQIATREHKINIAFMRLLLLVLKTAVLITAMIATAQAEPREKHEHNDNHNYIIERQQAGQVEGTPTTRRIRGSREIDIYSDGSMFEGNNYVGNAKR